jgi:hypothetical protein
MTFIRFALGFAAVLLMQSVLFTPRLKPQGVRLTRRPRR